MCRGKGNQCHQMRSEMVREVAVMSVALWSDVFSSMVIPDVW